MFRELIQEKIKTAKENLSALEGDTSLHAQLADVASLVTEALRGGNKLLICGNGGSAADAQHIAGELVCRFYHERRSLPAIALTTDTSVLTAIGNDYSYDDIFARQTEGLGKKGDVLFGISTSGNSANVYKAFQVAQKLKMPTILLTGNRKGKIEHISDFVLAVPSDDTPRIQ